MQQTPPSAPPFSQTCAFCRIIRGEEQAALVFEDALSLVFLDRSRCFLGTVSACPRLILKRLQTFLLPWSDLCFRRSNGWNEP